MGLVDVEGEAVGVVEPVGDELGVAVPVGLEEALGELLGGTLVELLGDSTSGLVDEAGSVGTVVEAESDGLGDPLGTPGLPWSAWMIARICCS